MEENPNKPSCHICSSASPFLLRKDGFDLYKCPKCNLVFVFPQPTDEFLKTKLYSYESGYQANRVGDLSLAPESERARSSLNYFERMKPQGKVLDVGCAHGQFMYWAKKRGFNAVGIELNKRTADSAVEQGFEVFNGFLSEAPFEKNSFDHIFLGEIIEHVPNPRQFIKDCSNFLKPDGTVAITTPNLDCFWSKFTFILYTIFKMPWSSVTPPYHLFQFSSDNLDALLKQEGFVLMGQNYLVMTRLKYELGMMHLLKRVKNSKELVQKSLNFIFMLFSFSVYTVLYIINILLHPLLEKDFNMIKFYKKI